MQNIISRVTFLVFSLSIRKIFVPIVFLCFCLFGMGSCGGQEQKEQLGDGEQGQPLSPSEKTKVPTDAPKPTADGRHVVLFFGNSITAGYQLELDSAFPALIQQKIDALGWPFRTVNAGLSGETTASGLSRIDWVLSAPVDVFVLELGANDGLRGLALSESKKNLGLIFDKVRSAYPEASLVLAGMEVPPNMGGDYTAEFRGMFRAVAEAQDAVLIPFLLEGVAGDPALNLADGIHPTEEGHRILAETVWTYLRPVLEEHLGVID